MNTTDPDEDVDAEEDAAESLADAPPELGAEADIEVDTETDAETDAETDTPPDLGHIRLLEAVLFASSEPLTERMLANRLPEGVNLKAVLSILQRDYAERGVNLMRAGKSWAFRTAPELAQQLNTEVDVPRKLSRAAIETLSIVAYHQPITRAEIEEVRGVGLSKGTMDVLLEASWIKPRGRRRTPGRPMTWGTTDGFLDHFGLENIRDLPGMDDLRAAGLLDSGPAISVYTSSAGENGILEDIEEETEPLLQLIEDDEDAQDDDVVAVEESDDPLNPGDGT
jgi:segregation and condensation protein B